MSDNIIYNFGELLRDLRREFNISQNALALKLSVSQDTISLWECGKSLPDFLSIKKLAEIFNVSADYLLGLRDY